MPNVENSRQVAEWATKQRRVCCTSAKSTATATAARRCNGGATIVNNWLLSQNITAKSAGSAVYCKL